MIAQVDTQTLNPVEPAAKWLYLEVIFTLYDPSANLNGLEQIAAAVHEGERLLRGFNPFAGDDLDMFQVMLRGEFNISGFRTEARLNGCKKPAARCSCCSSACVSMG